MLQRALANVAAVVAIMAVAVVAVAADAPTPLRSLCTDDGTISREALSVQVTGCISLSECQVVLDRA